MIGMRWTRIGIAAVLGLVAGGSALGEIRWVEKDYDFGLMREEGGPKTGLSRFVNVGPDTISIFSVKPSCGCTSADFSDAPLAPGDTATVSYTYDPAMRPGKFDKTVRVRLSDSSHHTIRITGNVLGTPESLRTLYPVDAGDMRLTQQSVVAREVVFGRSPMFFLNAYSLPIDSISPTLTTDSKALIIKRSQPKVGPGDIETFSINFDSRAYGAYGPVEIPMTFNANPANPDSPTVEVSFRAFVLPDTEALLVRQQGRNPSCDLPQEPIQLGPVSGTKPIKVDVVMANRGKGPLHLLNISSTMQPIGVAKLPKEIKPGKSATVRIEVSPENLPEGPYRFPVNVITDDPDHPHQVVYICSNKQ